MKEDGRQVETFFYAECPEVRAAPSWTGWGAPADLSAGGAAAPSAAAAAGDGSAAGSEACSGAEAWRAFAEGRLRGIEEGRRQEREARAAAEAAGEQERVRCAAGLLEEFARARDDYLREVEREVVKLAMAVAAHILRRESDTDPLLVIGAVRVALGQIPAATEVRLLVPAAELDLWTEAIALLPNLPARPQVIAGEGMERGDCRIETSLGGADLGVRAQLAETERALLARGQAPRVSLAEADR